jgi:hypothetical protein
MRGEARGSPLRGRGGVIPEPEETELNMTPMIDIVFQLIVFFLLSLKFRTIDQRIDSMLPHGPGLQDIPVFDEPPPKIKVKLFRRNVVDEGEAYTLMKVDNVAQFRLPPGWKGRAKESAGRIKQHDDTIAALRARVKAQLVAHGGDPDDIAGEIVAPLPRGGSVPHGDAMAVLDAFLELGITNVRFEGTPTPLTSTERAARNSR